jgi:hypothetical protein
MCPGVTRDQVVARLSGDVDMQTWDLIQKGVIAHWFYKVGDQPGIIALVNCDSLEEARTLVDNAPKVIEGLFEFDIDPVNHFPRFD